VETLIKAVPDNKQQKISASGIFVKYLCEIGIGFLTQAQKRTARKPFLFAL